MAASPTGIKVAIVGGGIAGLTAALRLVQSGCKVTVYEKDSSVCGISAAIEIRMGTITTSILICSANGTITFGDLSES
jgi:uncharacterized protein with NAD-binding domain and iron-sulfur cluster